MNWIVKALPFCAALAITPAFAADADQHAAHHPDAATNAATDSGAAPPAQSCPKMNGQMMNGQTANGQMMGRQGAQSMAGMGMAGGASGQPGKGGPGPDGAAGQSGGMGGMMAAPGQTGAGSGQCPHMQTQPHTPTPGSN